MRLSVADVSELALSGVSGAEFRREIATAMVAAIGGLGAMFHRAGRDVPVDTSGVVHFDRGLIPAIQHGWDRYARELAPAVVGAAAERAVVDTDVLGPRHRRLAFTREVLEPRGIGSSLYCDVSVPGRPPWLIIFSRARSDRAFQRAAIADMRELVPVIALANAAVTDATPPWNEPFALNARERQLAEMVRLGYTNAQIALVVGLSPNTVRNQLSALYRRVGVGSRAELVGALTEPRDPAPDR